MLGAGLATIDDPLTRLTVGAEREFLAELGGDCDLPAGAYAELLSPDDGTPLGPETPLRIVGFLAADDVPDGVPTAERGDPPPPPKIERSSVTAPAGESPGRSVARRLRARLG